MKGVAITAFMILSVVALKAQGLNNAPLPGDTAMENWLVQQKIPILALGVIRNGEIVKSHVYGKLKNGQPAPINTIFNVASLTKPIVAYLSLVLASQRKWNIDEPLENYWVDPDIRNDPRHKLLTTRLVLSHQTGFSNWRWNNASGKLEFNFDPGTQYSYSGEGFEYLRKAMEKKTGKRLDSLAKEYIFGPFGMKDTRFTWTDAIESRFAIGFNREGVPYSINKNKNPNAADDITTTLEDYGRFLVAVLDGKGLSNEFFSAMVNHQVKIKENKYFGLGWEIFDLGRTEYALSHGGADEGVRTQVFLLPKTREGIIMFTNVDDGYKVYEKLMRDYLKERGAKIIEIEFK